MSDPEFEELEEDFGEVMAMLREGPVETPTEKPSEDVWTAIAIGVGGDVAAAATVLDRSNDESYPGPADAANSENKPKNNVVSLSERRATGKRFAIITAVAAGLLLVALPLGMALSGNSPDQRAELAALPGFDGAGSAELNGRTLEVDLEGLDAPEGSFYELWLLNFDGDELADLQSLGQVGADGSFTVPDDVDLDEFSVVDVSIELDDGNPDHSGDSVLRGGLEGT
ncbi:MAG: anti-sigma factor [Acidimicrobiales bacterium]